MASEHKKNENQIVTLKKELISLKSNLSELYTSIGDYTLHIIFEISNLRGVLFLYSDYYCSIGNNASNTLFNELLTGALKHFSDVGGDGSTF